MERVAAASVSLFGEIERTSRVYPWRYTNYYDDISPDLSRVFFSFKGMAHPGDLAIWKAASVRYEEETSLNGHRTVNIDPGYLDGARLVLASTKDNAQRVYIRDGIYAEVTMTHSRDGWSSYPYTFPDFASGVYDEFFDVVRSDWKIGHKNWRSIT